MKTILLTQGKVALVDDEDYERLSKWHWTYDKASNRAHHGGFLMSHAVFQTDNWLDHKDRDGLNNQKSNLRICTTSQNNHNRRKGRRKGRKTSSIYKGVYGWLGSWKAQIGFLGISGQQIHRYLGCFSVEEEAAKVYDQAAREYFGEFAALNFPREEEQSCLR